MGFGKLLEEKMKQRGVKQAELADAVGLPKTTLSSMILRDNTKIEIEKFLKICEYLNCDPEEFYAEFKNQPVQKMPSLFTSKYHQLDDFGKDLVNTVLEKEYERCIAAQETIIEKAESTRIKMSTLSASAGTGEYLDGESYRHITVKMTDEAEQADFAVKVNGDSMEDTYFDGDILLVESTPHINVGEVGVFIIDGEGFVKEFGGDRLISHNDNYDDILLRNHDMVICSGRVIGVAEIIK